MTEIKIPKTKREAYAQLEEMLSDEDKSAIMNGDPIQFHFSLGMWIRNNWIYGQEEEDVKRLAKAFRTEMLFFEADSLSEKIIEYYQRYLKRKGLQIMGTLKEYQCNGCGYTITGTRKGRTLGMMGEIETNKVPRKCSKCGGDMKETGTVIMID